LSVGNPKTVLKGGYVGWKGGSSFASLWFERWLVWACKCAYDCALAIQIVFCPFQLIKYLELVKMNVFLFSMNKKQLFKTALISSPIMAAFEISPVFFLMQNEPRFSFGQMFVVLTLFTLVVWALNIQLIYVKETKRPGTPWVRYIFSYLLTLALVFIISFLGQLTYYQKGPDSPSPIFLIINILALNTIILILAETILMRSKKMQTEVELAQFKIRHLEAEHQQLVQQLQPHFLFNSLSTLKSLINNDAGLAEEYLVKLSEFLRFTISANENTVIKLSEEVQFTSDYIDLQKIRFSGSFFSEISIPEEITKTYKIPIYALQTLVENAIKHNAFTKNRPLKLTISYKNDSVIVSNNKIPKPTPVLGNGVGLKNLEKRYSLVTDNAIEINDTEEAFTVKIKLLK
jgi:sensor histidine kinase YesM